MTGPVISQEFSDLVGRIYDCSLDPSRWEATLTETLGLLGCNSAVLHINDTSNNRLLLHKGVGLDPQWVERMAPYMQDVHALLPSNPDLEEPHVLSRDVPRSVVAASPYVQEWM